MTEEELTRIEEALRTHEGTSNWDGPYGTGGDDVYDDAADLLAEVRRLRGLLDPLVSTPPWSYGIDESTIDACGYCHGDLAWDNAAGVTFPAEHAADCPWRLAYEALHTSPSRVR